MSKLRLIALMLCAALPLAAQSAAPAPSLAESLKAAGRFSTFLSLQELAGATQGQRGATQGQRTYFAPNDAAFAKLGAGTLEQLKKDPKRLDAFLRLHSVPSKLMVADMFENVQGSKKAFETTEGHVLGFQCNGHEGAHFPHVKVFDGTTGAATGGSSHVKVFDGNSGTKAGAMGGGIQGAILAATPQATRANVVQGNLIGTDSLAWNAPAQGRIGKFQDIVVAEGVVHEIDGVLLADGISR